MQNARDAYFTTQTFLGKVEAAMEGYRDKNIFEATDTDCNASDEEILTQFMNTVATGDAKKILLDLKDIRRVRGSI